MVETGLHEMLAQSPHRTLDPEEADFFYVPVSLTPESKVAGLASGK